MLQADEDGGVVTINEERPYVFHYVLKTCMATDARTDLLFMEKNK